MAILLHRRVARPESARPMAPMARIIALPSDALDDWREHFQDSVQEGARCAVGAGPARWALWAVALLAVLVALTLGGVGGDIAAFVGTVNELLGELLRRLLARA